MKDHKRKAHTSNRIFSPAFFFLSSCCLLFSKVSYIVILLGGTEQQGLKLASIQKFATRCKNQSFRRNHRDSVNYNPCYKKEHFFLISFLQDSFLVQIPSIGNLKWKTADTQICKMANFPLISVILRAWAQEEWGTPFWVPWDNWYPQILWAYQHFYRGEKNPKLFFINLQEHGKSCSK